jgi:microcystin-dependent protein
MGSPYVGEIRCFGFSFAPAGWAFCNGQLMPISENEALFAIIGTTYGGDGQSTYGLPNLQGRVPMHAGNGPGGFNTTIGEVFGTTSVTLTVNQIPQHAHAVFAESVAPGGGAEHSASPTSSAFIGSSNPDGIYKTTPTIDAPFSGVAIGSAGGSQPHENMQPYLALNFCIALFGIFPSQN